MNHVLYPSSERVFPYSGEGDAFNKAAYYPKFRCDGEGLRRATSVMENGLDPYPRPNVYRPRNS